MIPTPLLRSHSAQVRMRRMPALQQVKPPTGFNLYVYVPSLAAMPGINATENELYLSKYVKYVVQGWDELATSRYVVRQIWPDVYK